MWHIPQSVRRRPVINLGNGKEKEAPLSSLNGSERKVDGHYSIFFVWFISLNGWRPWPWLLRQVGYWNLISGRGCQPCGCDGTGAVDRTCHPTTGACYCLPGVGGQSCDRCLSGFFGFSSAGCKGKKLFDLNFLIGKCYFLNFFILNEFYFGWNWILEFKIWSKFIWISLQIFKK
jgi:hypothetical protein